MEFTLEKTNCDSRFIRIGVKENGKEAGHAYLFLITNDLHSEPYGLVEDVMVDEGYQKQGLGTKLVKEIIATAKSEGCYKLIATSRFSREHVHTWYEKLGFVKNGFDFRINFEKAEPQE